VLANARPDALQPIPSGFGFPYARLDSAEIGGTRLLDVGPAWSTRLTLVVAAEISGNAARAVGRTADHIMSRTQFGQTLASFQALRHRLSEAAVSAEATRWLVRDAAYHNDARAADLAAAYAAQTAAQLVPELVQLCGARSFTITFGLHVFTMRLDGLRLELGGPDRLAGNVLAHPPA
jgi:alkylation response protein AidB-like acyl-CoA dehydrogenase